MRHPLQIFNWASFLQTQIFMLPVLSLFYLENGLTIGDYFLFQGIFSIAALVFEIPAGYLGDIFPRKNILILSYSLFVVRLLLWLFFGGYWILLAGEILYAASKACYSGVADGYIYDYLKSKGKTRDMLKRYGRLNFFMSVGTAIASVSGAALYEAFNKNGLPGFMILISIELVFNTASVLMLFLLPKVPPAHREIVGFKEKYLDLYNITKTAFKNPQISWYVIYSGILAASTMLFVWGFQPLMKSAGVAVAFFGVIYGVNHGFRALSSGLLHKFLALVSLRTLGKINYVLYLLAFSSAMLILQFPSPWLCMVLLVFICAVIGCQLSFTLGSISRLHTIVTSDVRSTVASINTMMSRMLSGIMLILFKFLLDKVTLQESYFIYLCLFSLSLFPLLKLLKLPPLKQTAE